MGMAMEADARSDPQLIEAFQRGDGEAFRPLVERHHRNIYRLALRICKRPQLAEEAVQEALINAFRGLKNFRGDSLFSTWLYRITFNAATNHMKRLPPEDAVDFEENLPKFAETGRFMGDQRGWMRVHDKDPVDKSVLQKELAHRLAEAVDSLPIKYRTAFQLVQVDGLSGEEAAAIMDISVEALKSRLHRARLYLREKMSRYFSDRK